MIDEDEKERAQSRKPKWIRQILRHYQGSSKYRTRHDPRKIEAEMIAIAVLIIIAFAIALAITS